MAWQPDLATAGYYLLLLDTTYYCWKALTTTMCYLVLWWQIWLAFWLAPLAAFWPHDLLLATRLGGPLELADWASAGWASWPSLVFWRVAWAKVVGSTR